MGAFYIYDEKLLYYLLPERWEDTKMDADIGLYQTQWPFRESEEFPVDSFTGYNWAIGPNFGPREDGTIYIQDEETEGNYFLRKDEDGSWREEFIAPYYLFDQSLWEEGYFYKKVVYLEGRLVVFLEQKGTGKLLMGEIILDVDLNGEDAAY